MIQVERSSYWLFFSLASSAFALLASVFVLSDEVFNSIKDFLAEVNSLANLLFSSTYDSSFF
jgi:hypothetical protein